MRRTRHRRTDDPSPIPGDCCQTRRMAQVLCPVVIAGEPGIGKSRLALETAGRAASHGLRVVTSRAVPQSATAAYRPLTDALVQLLRDRAVPDDATMEPWLPALSALLPGMAGRAPAR